MHYGESSWCLFKSPLAGAEAVPLQAAQLILIAIVVVVVVTVVVVVVVVVLLLPTMVIDRIVIFEHSRPVCTRNRRTSPTKLPCHKTATTVQVKRVTFCFAVWLIVHYVSHLWGRVTKRVTIGRLSVCLSHGHISKTKQDSPKLLLNTNRKYGSVNCCSQLST